MTTTLSNIEALHRLADAYGVATNFSAFDGSPRVVADKTVLQVLEAMGVVGVDDTNIEAFIDARINRNWYRVLPQVVVAREDIAKRVEVHVPHGAQVHLEVLLENGGTLSLRQVEDFTPPREINSVLTGQAAFEIHQGLPLGYHKLRAYVQSFGEEQQTYETTLIVTPGRLAEPFISGKRSWGMMAQLYSVRSRESWGIGDLADLAELSSIFGDHDADFVLINPLHAAEPVGHMTPSPYLPVTRRFFNPIYIRPEDIREVAYLTPAQRSLITWAGEQVKASSLKNEHIDRDAAWKAKREALEVIYLAGRSEGR
ncbi:MAG: 4-alpha-glucanotransferase, partial [Arcanobacterium sp.]|nr:4-alpha-glucanotransferase [Arcanobacterium sp.]